MMTIEKLDELRENCTLLLEVKRERERAVEAGEVPSTFERDAARARYAVAKGAVEDALVEWWSQGCKNPPLGATDEVVVLTQDEFSALPVYNTSMPTGTTIGKRWRLVIGGVWWMGEYIAHADPGVTVVRWSKINVTMGHHTVQPYAGPPSPAEPNPGGALDVQARAAVKLLRDVARVGLMQGGEQYPNALCCIDTAQALEAATEAALLPRDPARIAAGYPALDMGFQYRVAKGDTLYAIAKKFRIARGPANTYTEGAAFLARLNNLSNPNRLAVGKLLAIPHGVVIDGALEAMWAEAARQESARADKAEEALTKSESDRVRLEEKMTEWRRWVPCSAQGCFMCICEHPDCTAYKAQAREPTT